MSELQVHEQVEVLVPLDRLAAEKLDGRIRRLAKQAGDQFVLVGQLLDEARAGQVHEVLGYRSWTEYVADSVGEQLDLSSNARHAMVQLMAGEGMSVRAIAAATGVSKSTVSNDLADVSNDWTPQQGSDESGVQPLDTSSQPAATVTGLDGKTYTRPKGKRRPKNKPTAEPAAESGSRKTSIPTAYRQAVKTLNPVVAELEQLTSDPRWSKARERFNDKDRVALDSHIASLQELRAAIGEAPTTASVRSEAAR